MQFPRDRANQLTERAMRLWLDKLEAMISPHQPRPSTTVYNAAYEAVYSTLKAAFDEER